MDAGTEVVTLPFGNNAESDPHWNQVNSALLQLKLKCRAFLDEGLQSAIRKYGDSTFWFKKALTSYSQILEIPCNFNIIHKDPTILWKLLNLLPRIIDHALKLPTHMELMGEPIPILKNAESKMIVLSRNLICSLTANAFLCTYRKHDSKDLSYFNFWKLFDEGDDDSRNSVKNEKLKCALEYFEQMGDGTILPDTPISFERYHDPNRVDWGKSRTELSELTVTATERIENATGMLQVDFANQVVGGGILSRGSVQEEIRFCINPELIVARLFTERLGCNDVLIVTGTRQFSSYEGYGKTFKFVKLSINAGMVQVPVDDYGREQTQIVAMDAINFGSFRRRQEQYKKDKLNRELHKSYLGFKPGKFVTPIATGNWGCGAFNGDPELKFLIQWMAASENGKRPVLYHARGYGQGVELDRMRVELEKNKVTVGKLYKALIMYGKSIAGNKEGDGDSSKMSVFQFIYSMM